MYFRQHFALIGLVVFCTPCLAADDKQAAAAELKWARGIADHFWEAVFDSDSDIAAGLMSSQLGLLVHRRAGVTEEYITQMVSYYIGKGNTASVVSQTLAPGGGEAIFKGVLTGRDDDGKITRTADYVMRIAREAPGGKWSIRYIRVKDREAKKR